MCSCSSVIFLTRILCKYTRKRSPYPHSIYPSPYASNFLAVSRVEFSCSNGSVVASRTNFYRVGLQEVEQVGEFIQLFEFIWYQTIPCLAQFFQIANRKNIFLLISTQTSYLSPFSYCLNGLFFAVYLL